MRLHQLFEGGMQKRSHSSLHCCGLPYVQLSRSLFLGVKYALLLNTPLGATDQIQTQAIHYKTEWTGSRGRVQRGCRPVVLDMVTLTRLVTMLYNRNLI